jgi:hypothetical protein
LVMATTDEALGIVKAVTSGDGIEAWTELQKRYSQRTMSRMMRVLMECMYPKEVRVVELGSAILQWEGKWSKMMKEQPTGTSIPDLWKMAALMKMCPKEIKKMIDLSWDAIDEKYTVMRDKVMTWAMNKAEEMGGPVPMDVGGVDGEWDDDGWDEGGEAEAVDAVYPTTRCYHCQGYGHMARECPRKGKGKGDMKGGGKGMTKGGYKGDGKGGGSKGGFKGDGKGGWGKGEGKGDHGFKGFGKGFGYAGGMKGGGKRVLATRGRASGAER